MDGEASSFVKVTLGVPQGTVFGPLIFLLFINDIHENLDSRDYLLTMHYYTDQSTQ